MAETEVRPIDIVELSLDLENYRYPPRADQRDALTKMAHHQNTKLANLAKDIGRHGMNPLKRFLVAPSDEGGYTVLEGNRRLAALMLLTNPELRSSLNLPPAMKKKFQAIADDAGGGLPTTVDCVIMSREDAKHWIVLEHSGGENDGVSTVGWDGPARHRFRGTLAFQAVDLVAPLLDEATTQLLPGISITNIERVLGTPEARQQLGVELANGKLTLTEPRRASIAKLATLVADVAHERIKVRDLDSKTQRLDYARRAATNPISLKEAPASATTTATKPKPGPRARRVALDRPTLIPKKLILAIHLPRVNKIYDELQRLRIKDFENSAAVLLRVFVELSADAYGARHRLRLIVFPKPKPGDTDPPKPKPMTLRQKIEAVADHLESSNLCDRDDLKGIRAVVKKGDHPLSLDSLHAYVHNRHYHPSVDELKKTFDNIQPFIEGIWKP